MRFICLLLLACTSVVTALIELQDAPLDGACNYGGDGGAWGLFSEQGAPNRAYYGMRAFAALLATPQRVRLTGTEPGRFAAWAGVNKDGTSAACLLSTFAGSVSEVVVQLGNLPWSGATQLEIRMVDAKNAFTKVREETLPASPEQLRLSLPAPAVGLVVLRPVGR
jgi:hypothetical protein